MIPKIIHQIWIGNKSKMPKEYIQTWINKHPDYEHILWDEEKINKLKLVNRDKYETYYQDKCFNGSANVARIEIVNRFGGIYIDADSTSNNSLDSLLKLDFFAVYSPNIENRVGNAFFGSVSNNKILNDYIIEVSNLKNLHPSWNTSGGTLFGKIIRKHNSINMVLPSSSFYTTDKNGNKVTQRGINYGTHYWGTTHKIY